MSLPAQVARALALCVLLFGGSTLSAQFSWSSGTPMPTGRAQAAIAATPGGDIYILGGYAGGAAFTSVDIYHTATDTWSTGPAMPLATRGATSVYFNNVLYVFGGYDASELASFQALDLATNTWTQGVYPTGGWETAAAVINGQIIVVGGEGSLMATSLFSPLTGTFTPLASSPNGQRAGQVFAIGNKLYLAGAEGASYDPTSTIMDVYDPATDTWSTAPTDGLTPRTQFAGGTDGRYIYLAGGSSSKINYGYPYYSSVEIYDTLTDTWSTTTSLPLGLRETAGIFVNGKFYVFGGVLADNSFSTDVFFTAVPEESTLALLALGLFGMVAARRRRRVAVLPCSARERT